MDRLSSFKTSALITARVPLPLIPSFSPRKVNEYVQEELINQEDIKQLWGKTYWTPYSNELIFCSRVLFDKNTMQQIGILTIGLDADFFRDIYYDITKEK